MEGLKTSALSKYETAIAKWNQLTAGAPTHEIFNRTQLYAGITLNSSPLQNSVGKNIPAGNISYNYTYDNRPTNYITNAKVENITINDTKPSDVVGRVVVLGRAAGPVLQDMGTITESKRTLNIDLIMPMYSGVAPITSAGVTAMLNASPTSQVQPLIDAMDENLRASFNQVFVESDAPTWNPKTGQYTRGVTWLYQDCILSAVSPPDSGAI